MKLIDKLKNALFEEEYVEVEEKPKRKPVKKDFKPEKKEHHRREVEEKPIAKKIVPPEKKQVKITHHDDEILENHHEGETLADESIKKKEFNFPLVSDNEFREEKPVKKPIKQEKKIVEEKKYEAYGEIKYQEKKTPTKAYGIDEINLPNTMYGAYEKKEERTYFHPSPIISPIYGILDKNYKKEEIVPKKEVRLTSAYAKENLDLDEVREKAFGIHSEESIKGADLDQYDIEESNFMDNDLLDLSEDKPEVKKVTVGDAEEYFEDLGLEYNVDYKDLSKDNTRVGRRYKEENQENESQPQIIEEKKLEEEKNDQKEDDQVPPVIEKKEEIEDKTDEDNLFDLIDSMYEKE